MIVEPLTFVWAMDRHWTTALGNVSTPLLRRTWDAMCRTFNEQAAAPRAHELPDGINFRNPWLVLDPATGTGKTQGLALYCSLLDEDNHPGVLIVTRLKGQAETIANTINALACKQVARAYHSGSKDSSETLKFVPVVVICHRAFEIGLDAINRGVPEQTNYEEFTAWGETGRRLIVIDEALNIVEEAQVNLEEVSYVLGVLPFDIKNRFPAQVRTLKQVQEILECVAMAAQQAKDEEGSVIPESPLHLPELPMHCDFTALRRELRSISFDRIVLRGEDEHARRKLAQRYDEILRGVQATVEQWRWYAHEPGKGHTLNTARTIVPEDAPGVVIMDATAGKNTVYRLLDNVLIKPTPKGTRRYDNVTLRVARGHRVGKRALSNKKTVRRTVSDFVASLEDTFGPERKVLVVCHKAVEAHMVQVENHFAAFDVAHFGAIDGRNDWNEYDVCWIFGLPYKPNTHAANVFMAVHGIQKPQWFTDPSQRGFGEISDVRKALKEGDLVVDCVQAFNRIRTRRVIDEDGNCDVADLGIHIPDNTEGRAILAGILDDLPGIKVEEVQSGVARRTKRRSNHEEALKVFAQTMMPGQKTARAIKSELGISSTAWERISKKLRNPEEDLSLALAEAGVLYAVEGKGRGSRSYLSKR